SRRQEARGSRKLRSYLIRSGCIADLKLLHPHQVVLIDALVEIRDVLERPVCAYQTPPRRGLSRRVVCGTGIIGAAGLVESCLSGRILKISTERRRHAGLVRHLAAPDEFT